VITFTLFTKLSHSALLQSTQKLRGNSPATETLVSTATASEDSEDGVESAEATVKEAEMEAAQQEATAKTSDGADDSTEQAAVGQPPAPSATLQTQPDKVNKARAVTAEIQTSSPKFGKNASSPKFGKNASRALAKRTFCGPRNIRLTIKGATGLKGEDASERGVTDPYCVCQVQGKPRAKVQTVALDGFHGVYWDHDGEIEDFLVHDAITCSIYDQDALASDPDYFLGRTDLVGTTALLSNGFKGELHLKDAGVHSAVLKLEIMPLALDGEAAAEDIQEMATAGCEDKSSKSDKDDEDDADEDDSDSDD